MAKREDWLPASREARIAMAENWEALILLHHARWDIPSEKVDMLTNPIATLKGLTATPKSQRTPAFNAEIRTSDKNLETALRTFKRRYFYDPPLKEADFISLGLKPKDAIPTAVGDPVGLVAATVKYPNPGAIELLIGHVEGTPFDERANYGVKIRYALFAADALPVDDVNLLLESRFTRRKKELLTFEKKDTGKTAVFCLRYENSKGAAGQWGPFVSALIP
jgi:hypothetical protein